MNRWIGENGCFARFGENAGEGMAATAGSSSSMFLGGDILHAVQMGRVFADSKHFVYVSGCCCFLLSSFLRAYDFGICVFEGCKAALSLCVCVSSKLFLMCGGSSLELRYLGYRFDF